MSWLSRNIAAMKVFFKKVTSKPESVINTPDVAPGQPANSSTGKGTASSNSDANSGKDHLAVVPEKYRGVPLTDEQKALVSASVPALQEHGTEITRVFYNHLIKKNPVLSNIFNKSNQTTLEQPRALAGAVLAYAQNINDLTPLLPVVELIANKHASLYVQPEQYHIIGSELIGAIAEVLGDAVTPELVTVWEAAYWQLAEILIKREHEIYESSEDWTDWKEFRIAKKVKESSEITSFYFEPVDANMKPLPTYKPGQYISIQVDVPSLGHMQTRQYSLSQPHDPNTLRISIKREPGGICPGLMSNLMHDTKNEGDIIRISHPAGDFFLDTEPTGPIVFISGGVGLTPLTAMLTSIVAKESSHPITWIHGAKCPSARAFASNIEALEKENLKLFFFDAADAAPSHIASRVDFDLIDKEQFLFFGDSSTQYYVCGPPRFMDDLSKALEDEGVPKERIHSERFGVGSGPK